MVHGLGEVGKLAERSVHDIVASTGGFFISFIKETPRVKSEQISGLKDV